MEQPFGHKVQRQAPVGAYDQQNHEFSGADLLDLNGPDVARITAHQDQPARSRVTYHCGTDLYFAQIARIIPCFTAGTLIATPDGEKPAQSLRPGDRVLTRDNGLQQIIWAGQKKMTMRDLPVTADMRPIRIRQGALGPNGPDRDMIVSPNHRMLITGRDIHPSCDQTEVLLPAKALAHLPGVEAIPLAEVTYIHFMCARHEIVFSDGAWTETFQPNDDSLQGIDAAQRGELLTIFPELASKTGRAAYTTARQTPVFA